MKRLLLITLCVCAGTGLFAQNWEVSGGFRKMTVKGSSLFIDPISSYDHKSDNVSLQEVDAMTVLGTVSIGLYIPVVKPREEFSIGLGSDLSVGMGYSHRNASSSYSAHMPVNVYARWGAGSVKRSRKAVGFGIGAGVEYNGLLIETDFENCTGYDTGYLSPCLSLEFAVDNFFGRKVRFQYRTSLVAHNDDYHNPEYDVDYGVDVMYHSLNLCFVMDFR
ncbi:hypothetical protein DMA11_23610 [Marinilabiliaceae bacterium JC017]|nr:hypothetical protein DMA11_23610 [Marinilabiliaceae bacterium JC017]